MDKQLFFLTRCPAHQDVSKWEYCKVLILLPRLITLSTSWSTLFQTFVQTGQEDTGRFCIRLYANMQWHYIYVDAFFPLHAITHKPIGVSSTIHHEFWPRVLEKALAKWMGSYETLLDLSYFDICSSLPAASCKNSTVL